ncbi:unnamed protein product [Discosporangium mesarthrocarpum]
MAVLSDRIRVAFKRHLIPQFVNLRFEKRNQDTREIMEIMKRYSARLQKVFDYFAVGDPPTSTTVPPPCSSSSLPRASQLGVAGGSQVEDGGRTGWAQPGGSAVAGHAEGGQALPRQYPNGISFKSVSKTTVLMHRHIGGGVAQPGLESKFGAGGVRCMEVVEFVGMLQSLGVLDSRLTLVEACRISISSLGCLFLALPQDLSTAGANAEEARAGNLWVKKSTGGQISSPPGLFIGEDLMGFEGFTQALYHCSDLKTQDGMTQERQRLDSFILDDLFEKFKAKCSVPAVWWKR